VPGELSTVTPFLNAKPLLGRTCASNPLGSSIYRPVLTSVLFSGFSKIGSTKLALRSSPADCVVAYSGQAWL